jgi:hypothetical protein
MKMKMKRKPRVKNRPVSTAAGAISGVSQPERNRAMQGGAVASAQIKGEQVKQEDALIVSWMDDSRYGGFKMSTKK